MRDYRNEPESGKSAIDQRAWGLVQSLAIGALKEQKAARRWGVFFKSLAFFWLFFTVSVFYMSARNYELTVLSPSGKHTALVEIEGEIGNDQVSADSVISSLRAAFKDKGTQAVILRINSPGGSPVQSGYIYDEIKRLRGIHEKVNLYAVIVDVGASGGYYIASAADEIYADKASLVGSIGVISSGFGFVGAMEKIGVTRRVYTAGENKAFLDPFQSLDKEAANLWKKSLNVIHKQFIQAVKDGRGERLVQAPDVFSGMVWSGEQAKGLGLIDGLGSMSYVAREIVGVEEIVDFTYRPSSLEIFAKNLGAGVSSMLVKTLGSGLWLR